jgi:NAD-dependent deacetylase
MDALLHKAAELIKNSKYCIAFTGAGVSVESGIPPFRGENSLWNRYDPKILELDTFLYTPDQSWPVIKEIFYDFFGKALPNDAHKVLAKMESLGLLKCIVTQNIDNLHYEAGSKDVYEFHGNSHRLVCTKCNKHMAVSDVVITNEPLRCENCEGLMKPDFVFFGEGIPEQAYDGSMEAVRKCDVCLIIGSTGEVMPAALVPYEAKRNGALVIEINPEESKFTSQITDIHLKGKAGEVLNLIVKYLE